MTPAFEELLQQFKKLPGLGYRSAERIAMQLLVEKPESLERLLSSLQRAQQVVGRCEQCGNLAEEGTCAVCTDERRDPQVLCVVEHVTDLMAIERSAAWKGQYHVLHGKLSPIHGVGPEDLNFSALEKRLSAGSIREIVLALSNDIEGQATCHYIQEEIVGERAIQVSRIGFGLPSGGGVTYADSVTLKSALEARRVYE
ncbi:recombination mediator RecR [Coraliomargarita akajimensis]|uniref:Recombination protein RecR n=1 Tax=Coraliomargarita akajimensis (strain DSM 45221 / IAM 15411 / JCM 23193 / KCTC 12865 / 04OKA010-24) TaxID=583355 RepID=D5ELW8_CORAD|nr:recombination mediator RecR [Coraliomargarita akajimensis]ADE53293.1 recombination protein RecR [Coraliomargarita akajimensis DSM 45221]